MSIPRRRLERLNHLAGSLAKRRIPVNSEGKSIIGFKSKANHAAYLLNDRGGAKMWPIVYGENHHRGRTYNAIHAEHDVIRRANGKYSNQKSYSLLVIKISNGGGLFGHSNCCLRCQWMLVKSPVRISRVYYSTPDGISVGKPGSMTPHLCEMDRKIEGRGADFCARLGLHCQEEETEEEEDLSGLHTI